VGLRVIDSDTERAVERSNRYAVRRFGRAFRQLDRTELVKQPSTNLNLTFMRYSVYPVLPMKNNFINVLYRLRKGPVMRSTYRVRKTMRYKA
jgi:hypothetical protein